MSLDELTKAVWWNRAYAAINERYYEKLGQLTGDYEKWKSLHADATAALAAIDAGASDTDALALQVAQLTMRIAGIEATEERPTNTAVMQEAQDDWNEATYGPGIRTNKQVREFLANRDAKPSQSQSL